jgi:hypothetical protein
VSLRTLAEPAGVSHNRRFGEAVAAEVAVRVPNLGSASPGSRSPTRAAQYLHRWSPGRARKLCVCPAAMRCVQGMQQTYRTCCACWTLRSSG